MNPNEAFGPSIVAVPPPLPAETYNMSPLTLFLDADPVVQGVMILLVAASVGCWALIIERGWRLASLRRQVRQFESSHRAGAPQPQSAPVGSVAQCILLPDGARQRCRTWAKPRARRGNAASAP